MKPKIGDIGIFFFGKNDYILGVFVGYRLDDPTFKCHVKYADDEEDFYTESFMKKAIDNFKNLSG